jgi:hypothetical protein
MNDWVGLGIIALLVLLGLFGISRVNKPYDITTEEFERRAQEGPGLLGAGLVGIQKALDPAAERAAEVQQDFKAGRYDEEDESGDPPETGDGGNDETINGEQDA